MIARQAHRDGAPGGVTGQQHRSCLASGQFVGCPAAMTGTDHGPLGCRISVDHLAGCPIGLAWGRRRRRRRVAGVSRVVGGAIGDGRPSSPSTSESGGADERAGTADRRARGDVRPGHRCCRAVDDGDWDNLVRLFTDDGTFVVLPRARGHGELRTFFVCLADAEVTATGRFSTWSAVLSEAVNALLDPTRLRNRRHVTRHAVREHATSGAHRGQRSSSARGSPVRTSVVNPHGIPRLVAGSVTSAVSERLRIFTPSAARCVATRSRSATVQVRAW